jgi:hypothetical protein
MSKKYFFDTEFYEDGKTIELISIGIVCDDGRELYLENNEFDWTRVPSDHWLYVNVRPILNGRSIEKVTKAEIRKRVEKFFDLGDGKQPEPGIYAYYADYDWVVLCQLFGTMMSLPKGMPIFCYDLKQMMRERGLHTKWKCDTVPDPVNEHNALADAKWGMSLWTAIIKEQPSIL